MTMLIDTREPAGGLPPWQPNWRVWSRAAAAVLLGLAAISTTGLVSILAIFAGLYLACRAIDEALPYRLGLTEWRQ